MCLRAEKVDDDDNDDEGENGENSRARARRRNRHLPTARYSVLGARVLAEPEAR